MKFKKVLAIGIDKSQLDESSWAKIRASSSETMFLKPDDPKVNLELKNTDCLLVQFNKVDKSIIDQSPNLKYIGALATGVGGIDTKYAASKKIVVTNIPGYSTESVSEFVIAALLENMREISRAKKESKEGNRSESGFIASEIKGKNFGVIGLGRIGKRVAELAQAFGAEVSYWSRERKKEAEKNGIKYIALDRILTTSDILSINLASNNNTKNFLNEKRVNKIKKGAILINTAPMELIDINALEKRLKGSDFTFIFDHTDIGDVEDSDLKRLQKHNNCITYPAIGYISSEAKRAKQEIFINNIQVFLSGKTNNRVN
ncbi:MAG TPA: 2-hydroxyacid dehydrogenase [Candidatus Saccharimonadales bacterium]|nr:2-hydroxyacid dehydrogenase [Candidatus Saccharimonadales bacterium]